MKLLKFISGYYLILGFGIIGLWVMLFLTGQIPELETEPISIAFHIVIEVVMGLMCILSGLLIIKRNRYFKPVLVFTGGMVSYSVVNSSGYYGDSGNFIMIAAFFIVLVFTLLSMLFITKKVL